MKYNNTTYT